MKFRGEVLASNKRIKQKLELLRNISKDASIQGVSTLLDIDNKLNQIDDYSPSIFFPLNELNQPLLFMKEFQDALVEARASEGLTKEYLDALFNLQEELYTGIRSIINDWLNIQQDVNSLLGYEKYLRRSAGSTFSILPISFLIAPEEQLESVFKDCYITLNNQLALPIKNKEVFPIRKTSIYGYTEDDTRKLNNSIQLGPFLFRITEDIEKENISMIFELEQEEQINHLRIPCCIPLPVHIDHIQLLDSSDRQTRLFDNKDLSNLLTRTPVALELLFPLTPVKRIKIVFTDDLDTKKLGLAKKTNLTEIESDLSPVLAKNIELLNARGQVDRASLETMVHDTFASFKTLVKKQELASRDVWSISLGGVLEASRTSFYRSGSYSTQVYEGKDVKVSVIRAAGQHVDHLNQLLDLDTSTITNTFSTFKLVKSCLDNNDSLVSRLFVAHPLSRPFNNQIQELLTSQDPQDRKSETNSEQQKYDFNIYASDLSSINFYTPTLKGPQSVNGIIDIDSAKKITSVTTNNLLLEDIITQYNVDIQQSPSLATFSESRPYYLSPSGSFIYKDPEDNITQCNIHLLVELHRVAFDKYTTPLVDNVTVILGHLDNSRSDS